MHWAREAALDVDLIRGNIAVFQLPWTSLTVSVFNTFASQCKTSAKFTHNMYRSTESLPNTWSPDVQTFGTNAGTKMFQC